MLGDPSWVGRTTGRPRFAKELARRLSHARSKGIDTSTLLLRDTDVGEQLNLIVKNGLTAVCQVNASAKQVQKECAPRPLHYGVWELPASVFVAGNVSWFMARRLMARARHAADDGGLFHLFVDAPTVVQQPANVEKTVFGVIQQLAQLKDRGMLKVETLSMTAARLSDVPAASPQRSLLRAAA